MPDNARSRLLSLADELAGAADADSRAPLKVTIQRGKTTMSYEADPAEVALLRTCAGLPEMESNIVQALAEASHGLESRELARLAGYAYAPRFRAALSSLKQKGLVVDGPDGLRLSLPPGQQAAR